MKKYIVIILCVSVFSCKTDNSLRSNIDGIWTSEKYDVEIRGTSGFLIKLHYLPQEINGITPQIGDTVIKNLIKINRVDEKEQKFSGLRMYLQPETSELIFDTAQFVTQKEKETERIIITSIIAGKDTIIFKN